MTDSDGTLAGPTERIGPDRDYREGAVGGGSKFIDYPIPPIATGDYNNGKTIQTDD